MVARPSMVMLFLPLQKVRALIFASSSSSVITALLRVGAPRHRGVNDGGLKRAFVYRKFPAPVNTPAFEPCQTRVCQLDADKDGSRAPLAAPEALAPAV